MAVSKSEFFTHIRSLGLSSVDEYQEWCQKHGFAFHRKKNWREEREELRVAEIERERGAFLEHVGDLGLKTIGEYQEWCRSHGFRDSLDKNVRQRRKERVFSEQLKENGRAKQQKNSSRVSVTEEHVRTLGLESFDEYRIWCLENGLSDALKKKPAALDKERALSTLTGAKRQLNKTRHVIEQIAAGEIASNQIKTIPLRVVHEGFAGLQGDGRDALLRLLLHVEECADLLNVSPGTMRWGHETGNTLIEGVMTLARHHEDWLRPVDEWRPASRNQQVQFSSLVRHLLARYEVPVFMDLVWFRGDDAEARRQQGWFKHVGGGGNIRTADVPVRMSKKMAHHFLQAPEHFTVEEALRWGQVLGQGGSPSLTEAINATRLGRSFDNEGFWGTVVQFFARQSDLDLNQVGPIVGYIQHRKYVPREDGGDDDSGETPLPAEPNFSMKSRSLPKLLGQVVRWQAAWNREPLVAEEEKEDPEKVKFNFFYLEEEDESTGQFLQWTIQELTTARSLASEGDAMRHCVGSYTKKLGKLSVWSVQVRDEERTRRVLTLSIDNETRTATQVRGRFNANPEKEFDESAMGWLDPSRGRGRLNRTDRHFLRRSYKIMHMWLEREGISYAPSMR